MGWDEALFGFFHRLTRRALKPKIGEDELDRSAHLATIQGSLRLFATALAGVPMDVHGSDGDEAAREAVVFVPRRLDVGTTREDAEAAMLVRVAFAAVATRRGLFPPASLDETARAFYALFAARLVEADLREELPRLGEVVAALAPALIARRPPLASLVGDDRAIEALTLRRLGVPWSELEGSLEPTMREKLRAFDDAPKCERGAEKTAILRDAKAAASLWPRAKRRPLATLPTLVAGRGRGKPQRLTSADRPSAGGTERRGRARTDVRRIELSEKQLDENPAIHSFEKVHTAEEYRGGKKRVDGSDEMADQGEALDELDLREVVRSRERARSIYRADAIVDGDAFEMADGGDAGGIPYDEWDERARSYRPGWCRVHVQWAKAVDDAAAARDARNVLRQHRREVESLRARFLELEHARTPRGRQRQGIDVDLDALVDRNATLRSGHSGSDRLYVDRRRRAPELTVMLLLDASLSTDSWVDDRRVLDVARDAITVLGDVLRDLRVETAVAAFHSHTRRDCRFTMVKDFTAPWERAAGRLAALEPTGYTRIGPALRHATEVLRHRHAEKKLLVLFSDGKPTDYDQYEGRHGIADVRKALSEAERAGLATFGLAIDAEARHHLPHMFGPGGFAVMPHVGELALAMSRVHGALLRT